MKNGKNLEIKSLHRLVVSGKLIFETSFHVGSGFPSMISDAVVERDKKGNPYIPGSTLAGALRATSEDFACLVCKEPDRTIRSLFGSGIRSASDDAEFIASRLTVRDAGLLGELPDVTEIRDHVGIDRTTGAAREGIKFDKEVVPSSCYGLELEIEAPDEESIKLLLSALDFWSNFGVSFGASTTTGMGRAKLESVALFIVERGDKDSLKKFLTDDPTIAHPYAGLREIKRDEINDLLKTPPRTTRYPSEPDYFLPQQLKLFIGLYLDEPVLVKSGVPEIPAVAADGTEQRTSDAEFIKCIFVDGDNASELRYLPGSSIKGVLRTRAEKIIRTLNYSHAVNGDEAYEDRIASCAATHAYDDNCRLRTCFGSESRQAEAVRLSPYQVYEGSCPVCRLFGNPMMKGRISCSDSFPGSEDDLTGKLFDNVAIDRFQGGAADQKKFDSRPLEPGESKAFIVNLRIERPELWMFGLLAQLLKDLVTGDIRIGYGSRRGFGKVRGDIEQVELSVVENSQLHRGLKSFGIEAITPDGGYGPLKSFAMDDWIELFKSFYSGKDDQIETALAKPGNQLLLWANSLFNIEVRKAEMRYVEED